MTAASAQSIVIRQIDKRRLLLQTLSDCCGCYQHQHHLATTALHSIGKDESVRHFRLLARAEEVETKVELKKRGRWP